MATDDLIPPGAAAAALAWLEAVHAGDFDAWWSLMPSESRRVEVTRWIGRNPDDDMLALYDPDGLVDALSPLTSDHRLRERLEWELSIGYREAIPEDTGPDDWAMPSCSCYEGCSERLRVSLGLGVLPPPELGDPDAGAR